ncbi:MAG: tyrosine-type recombinase/integrase, partial [Pseudomonadota bacterium]
GDVPLGPTLRVTGKGGRQRDVPVLPAAGEAVQRYCAACPHRPGREGPLFLGQRGGAMRRAQVAKVMAEGRRALGLPDSATPHALRHAFATEILAGSGDLRAVQTLLGHRSLSSTQIYTRIDDARLRAVHAAAHPRGRR